MVFNNTRSNKIGSSRSGQTLVIAIMVMFVVALVAAVFIGLVARNLFRSERFSNMDEVAQIAEGGVQYADKMLTTSEEGADWRPTPDNDGLKDRTKPAIGIFGEEATDWEYQRDKYPDFRWTRAYYPTELPAGAAPGQGYAGPTGGYTTFPTGGGRFLLRVSYNPDPSDPLSKHIKIESIGRLGVFDKDDPTTYKPYGNISLRREITAYKPIGLTDYLRFITNKDDRSTDFPLGCPGYHVKFGQASDARFGYRGAPIRVNGNLMWYGIPSDEIKLFLRGVMDNAGKLTPIDMVEVAGDIKLADSFPVNLYALNVNGGVETGPLNLLPSDDGSFSSQGGFYRDSRPQIGDATRRIKRIEPPLIDQPDTTNSTTRYRLLTLNSGERVQAADGSWVNLGGLGWGRGIYISNTEDRQDESETLIGGYSVRSDWLKPNNPISPYWKGPFYIPPGVMIVLEPNDFERVENNRKQYYFRITRTDGEDWYDCNGIRRPDWGRTIRMPYPDCNYGRVMTPSVGGDGNRRIEGNGVIYAEGNVRIRGMLPPNMQLTVVSGENIYIEGSLLKYRDPAWRSTSMDTWRGADPTCGLALLAKQNICVNTTQFFAPQNGIGSDSVGSDAQNGQPPYHIIVTNEPDSRPRIGFELGPWESDSGANAPSNWYLFLRHSGQYGSSYINAWLNPSDIATNGGILALNNPWPGHIPAPGLPEYIWGIGDPGFNGPASGFNCPGWGIGSAFIGEVFPLNGITNAHMNMGIGVANLLQIALDQTTYTRSNYLLGGLAVQPFDVRIEAVLYAQEGSFFVLPGNWFNPNPSDTESAYAGNNNMRLAGERPMFPFFGQPLDIRIIVDGAVSENMPAPISDVEEWMAKWGKIPEFYGSSNVHTAHPGEGLTLLYDDHVGWPLASLRDPSMPWTPIRTDIYNRPLPIAPRLPVARSLIYFGDVM
ncbi:MAG: hypothetical protein M1133_06315 [Armatimonadetes bacterium]|nr:hypothetical protein [Armatimonadota bacterium]